MHLASNGRLTGQRIWRIDSGSTEERQLLFSPGGTRLIEQFRVEFVLWSLAEE